MKFDKTEKRVLAPIIILGLTMIAASFLVGCKSTGEMDMSWLPASQDYAAQVARDNAASAATNPASFWLWAGGTIISSLAGAAGLIRRGINRFDEAPFEGDDGVRVTEGEIVDAVKKMQGPGPSA